jgi:hypothetical protein
LLRRAVLKYVEHYHVSAVAPAACQVTRAAFTSCINSDGAQNSFGTRVGGIGTNDSVDAGGGGGGVGLIKAPATANLGANVSPAPAS